MHVLIKCNIFVFFPTYACTTLKKNLFCHESFACSLLRLLKFEVFLCLLHASISDQGKKATAFPALSNKLSDPSEAENRVVVDGYLITSRGPGTSMEFALSITEKFFGREKALELAKTMVFVQ